VQVLLRYDPFIFYYLFAVILQHEFDHLLGKVFIDRMTDLTMLSLRGKAVNSIATRKASIYLPGSPGFTINNPPVINTGFKISTGTFNSVDEPKKKY
jgi:hypothetical protein